MMPRRKQRGFVLLMVLVVVVLAAAAMVGMVQRSMLQAVHVKARSGQLQRKWAVRSMQQSLMGRLPEILDRHDQARLAGSSGQGDQVGLQVRLAGREYRLVVTDQQARVNVNSLRIGRSQGETESLLRRLVGPDSAAAVELAALPENQLQDAPSLARPIGAWGQIFPHAGPADLLGVSGRPGLTARITCFSDGRINLARADGESVRTLCNQALTPAVVDALLTARDHQPDGNLGDWIGQLDQISQRDAHEIRRWLTDRSECFGLWIVTSNGARTWYHFAVGRVRPAARPDGDGPVNEVSNVEVYGW
ncbi:MAG: hypothetical protein ACLFUJ_05265 [Phycisphaerae bacterium]